MRRLANSPQGRNRLTRERARLLIAVSIGIDLLKAGVLVIPLVGFLVNVFILVPLTTIGLIHWLYVHFDVGPGGRGGAQRLALWFFLGPIPFSTTLGSLFTIRHVRKEDTRYNVEHGLT